MNALDYANLDGLLAQLEQCGEIVYVGNQPVAAVVDRMARSFDMLDAGYREKEPINVEILKGNASSTANISIDGVRLPRDLRGATITMQTKIVVDGVTRKISNSNGLFDGRSFYRLTTLRSNSVNDD